MELTGVRFREGQRALPQVLPGQGTVSLTLRSESHLFVSFNGGKDATVVLFLTLLARQKYVLL
jgi:hypothetical protein